VIVFFISGLAGIALLASVDAINAVAAASAGAALSWLSYRAAVTSARAYGAFLTTLVQFELSDERMTEDISGPVA
jgi:hypothetical protein